MPEWAKWLGVLTLIFVVVYPEWRMWRAQRDAEKRKADSERFRE